MTHGILPTRKTLPSPDAAVPADRVVPVDRVAQVVPVAQVDRVLPAAVPERRAPLREVRHQRMDSAEGRVDRAPPPAARRRLDVEVPVDLAEHRGEAAADPEVRRAFLNRLPPRRIADCRSG